MQAVLKLLFVTDVQDYLEMQEQLARQEQPVQLVPMAHLVLVDLEMERDLVLAHLVLVHVMMLSKLNSSTHLLVDSSR
jgi:hypothetical protein